MLDRLLQLRDADKGPASHGLLRQFPEPALHLIEPTGTGRNKVQRKAGMALEPRLDLGVFVGAVIVQHQMKLQLFGELVIQSAQEFQEFLMAMPGKTLADDFAFQYLQGRK